MSDMSVMPPAMMALMTAAMMVAMMLPSVAPTLWHYHRRLHAMRISHPGERTALCAAGYASVWSAIGLGLWALTPVSGVAPFAAGAVVQCAGVLQCSRWKRRRLLHCREECLSQGRMPWLDGCRLGFYCSLSCAAPMAVLLVAGLMNPRMMLVITAAITLERLAPHGARIAQLTGTLALVAGSVMCVGAGWFGG